MSTALRHWKSELNYLLNLQEDLESEGKELSRTQLSRVKFVKACIKAHTVD